MFTQNLHTDVYGSFIVIAKTFKQPRYYSVGEWIKKLWYIQAMQYYLALKRNELLTHEKTWGNVNTYY